MKKTPKENLFRKFLAKWNEPDNSESSARVRMNQTHPEQKPATIEKIRPSYTSWMISQNRFDKLGREQYKQLNEDYLRLLNFYNETENDKIRR